MRSLQSHDISQIPVKLYENTCICVHDILDKFRTVPSRQKVSVRVKSKKEKERKKMCASHENWSENLS